MQQGYYTNRLIELEKRKEEATAKYVTSKLTLDGINKEIDKCFEYMNSAHYDGKVDVSDFEKKIVNLKLTVKRKNTIIKEKSSIIKEKNDKLNELNEIIFANNQEIKELELKISQIKDDYDCKIIELEDNISELHKLNNEYLVQKHNYISNADELKKFKKENRDLKQKVNSLNEQIGILDDTLVKKNKDIQILHERLNWLPKSNNNVMES